MKDYYAVLQITPGASNDEIKRAYRRLAVVYHPDKNADPQAEVVFREINEAYRTLSDPRKRHQYDERLRNPFAFSETFESPVQRHRDPRYRPKPPGYRPPEKTTTRDVMKSALRYLLWVDYAGITIALLFAIDFFIPYRISNETIHKAEVVSSRSYFYFDIHTDEGTHFKIYADGGRLFHEHDIVQVSRTRIFHTVMNAALVKNGYDVQVGALYKLLALFPTLLFLCSSLAIAFRKQIDFPFNLSIASAIFLVITLFLIF